jgi:hypothetical protein
LEEDELPPQPHCPKRFEPVAVAPQQRQLLDPAMHGQVLTLDDASHLLGGRGVIE